MKVAQIGSYPIDEICIKGGVEASVYGLAKGLSELQHTVNVFDVPRQNVKTDYVENFDKVQVWRFANKSNNNIWASLRSFSIVKKIRNEQPDICHIHGTGFFSLFMWILLRMCRLRVFLTVHGLIHIEQQNAYLKKRSIKNFFKLTYQSISEFLILSLCREIIVDTLYVENEIKYYKQKRKIWRMPVCHIIPQGISEVYFKLENKPLKNNLLSVGAIGKRKGYLFLLEAVKIVKEMIPDIKLTIAGSINNIAYFNQVKSKIEELGLKDNVVVKENVPFNTLLDLYRIAEIFVLHSEEESQGIVLCEAMAVGLPIVATNIGGIPNVVENNKNGLLSPFSDVNTFVKNIITLLNNEDLRNQMSIANKKEVLKYDWKKISETIIIGYRK